MPDDPRSFLAAMEELLDQRNAEGRGIADYLRTGDWPAIAKPKEFVDITAAIGDGSSGMFARDKAEATRAAALIAAHLASYATPKPTEGAGRKRTLWSRDQVDELLDALADAAEQHASPTDMVRGHPAAMCAAYLAFGAPWRLLRGPRAGERQPCYWLPCQRILAATGVLDYYADAYQDGNIHGLDNIPPGVHFPRGDVSELQGVLAAWWQRGLREHQDQSLHAARTYIRTVIAAQYTRTSRSHRDIIDLVFDAAGLLYDGELSRTTVDGLLTEPSDSPGSVRWMLDGAVATGAIEERIATTRPGVTPLRQPAVDGSPRGCLLVFLPNGIYTSTDGGERLDRIYAPVSPDAVLANRYAVYRQSVTAAIANAQPHDASEQPHESNIQEDVRQQHYRLNQALRSRLKETLRFDIGKAAPIQVCSSNGRPMVKLAESWRVAHAFAPNPALFAPLSI
jgi:hypothetical protein